MKTNKLSESKILTLLKAVEEGQDIELAAREYGIATSTYYTLKERYGGMTLPHIKKLKRLEAENNQLKHMYAEAQLEIVGLKDIVEKKL